MTAVRLTVNKCEQVEDAGRGLYGKVSHRLGHLFGYLNFVNCDEPRDEAAETTGGTENGDLGGDVGPRHTMINHKLVWSWALSPEAWKDPPKGGGGETRA